MEYYPVYLNLSGKKVLVVGGGNVALRKVKRLICSGAEVKVVARDVIDGFNSVLSLKGLDICRKNFEPSDIEGINFVFSATDDKEINAEVAELAEKKGVFCNIADAPDKSDFIVPASIRRGDLMLAVSTGGKSPALSRKLRKDLEKEFGDEYEIFLYFLGEIRCAVLEKDRGNPCNKDLFREMVFGNLLKSIKEKDIEGIEKELREILKSRDLADSLMDKLLEEKNRYFFDVEKNGI